MAENEEQDEAQKTEEPTPKKIEEARKKGQVALSRELNNWVMLLMGTILLMALAQPVFSNLSEILITYIEQAHAFPSMPGGLGIVLGDAYWEILRVLILPFLLLMAAAFLSPFVQVGPLFAPEAIKPDLSKISPIKGFFRLFSLRSLMEFAKGIIKIFLIALVVLIILYPYYQELEHMVGLPMPLLMQELQSLIVKMMIGVLVVMLIVAVIDVAFQRMEHHKKMRMTKQELKDEYKQTEGDPHVKQRLRQLRSERARQRMMQAVPEADVVITNPTHYSIALKYETGEMEAPVCVAKGVDELALRIREVAKENDVVVYENKPLARALYDVVEIDEMIPPEHFKAVAEIISYVFKQKGRLN